MTVKPADPNELHRQHQELHQRTESLRELAAAADFDWHRVDLALTELEQLLSNHFEMEELGGYMSWVLEVQPDCRSDVRRLHGTHDLLWQQLRELRHLAIDKQDRETFGERLVSWVDRLHSHEKAENELIARCS